MPLYEPPLSAPTATPTLKGTATWPMRPATKKRSTPFSSWGPEWELKGAPDVHRRFCGFRCQKRALTSENAPSWGVVYGTDHQCGILDVLLPRSVRLSARLGRLLWEGVHLSTLMDEDGDDDEADRYALDMHGRRFRCRASREVCAYASVIVAIHSPLGIEVLTQLAK